MSEEPTVGSPPPREARPSPARRRRSRHRLVIELVIVTAGVLIALLLDGLVEWYRYRVLVHEARATIAREISDNRQELQATLDGIEDRNRRMAQALRFAEELMARQRTEITDMNLGVAFP
jgi:hypothetical protein